MPTKKASNQNATLVCSTTEKAVRKVALFLLGQFRVRAHRRRRSFVTHPENTENTDSFAEAPQSRKRGQSPFLRDGDTAGDTTLPINGLRKTLGMTSRTPVNVQGTLAGSIAPITLPHAQLIDIALQHASASGPSSTGEDDQKQDISDGGDERKSAGQGILKPNQSCDTCRVRKIKCAFPPGQGTGASEKKCTRCIELEIQCNFTYSVKKRGPPKGSVRRSKKLKAESGASTQYQLQGEPHLGSPNNTATLARSYHLLNGGPSSIDTSITNSLTSPYPGSVGAGLPLSRQKYTLNQFFDREVVQRLIYLYIDYLWHLTPCFHIPSFLADFLAQRDLHDTDFLAVVMALSTFTLVALPKAWLPLEKSGIYQKVWDSLEGLQAILFTLQNYPPTLSTTVAYYLLSFTHHNLDRIGVSSAYLGVVLKGSHYLRLFDPLTYLDLNPIDAEVAKRLYWLIHGGDKTAAALVSLPFAISTRNSLSLLLVTQSDTPVLARSSDYGAIDLPRMLDDRYITATGYLQPDTSQPPLIIGFYHITRLFCILEEVLALYRTGRYSIASPEDVTITLGHLATLLHRNQVEMVDCIPELRLRASANADSTISDIARLSGFYDQQTVRHNAFLVAQANIYCTQALIRYYIFRCRSSLVNKSGLRLIPDPRQANETLESICHDLLHVLRSIPIEWIAANGKPLTAKVRYIVSGLLDPEANEGRILIDPRAQQDLLDFLHLMSEIDRNASLETP